MWIQSTENVKNRSFRFARWGANCVGLALILGGLVWLGQKFFEPGKVSALDVNPLYPYSAPLDSLDDDGGSVLPRPIAIPEISSEVSQVNRPSDLAATPPMVTQRNNRLQGSSLLSTSRRGSAVSSNNTPAQSLSTPVATPETAVSSNSAHVQSLPAPVAVPGIAVPEPLIDTDPLFSDPGDDFPFTDEVTVPPTLPNSIDQGELVPEVSAPLPVTNDLAYPPVSPEPYPVAVMNPLPSMEPPYTSPLPGKQELEGIQTAQVSVEKVLPGEIQVGAETTVRIVLKNTGLCRAVNVSLWDALPAGAELVESNPTIGLSENGLLVWNGFDLAPNEERDFEYVMIPHQEGEIGSVASVLFATEVSVRSRCTSPKLELNVSGPESVLVGEELRLQIAISNIGTGTAREVILSEEVPSGLRHRAGQKIENLIGEIGPGETKNLSLVLNADASGAVTNHLSVTAWGGLTAEAQTPIQVTSPELSLEISGSKTRYLEREACYTMKVWNPGTAPARNVRLVAALPPQMKFVRTNNEGVYRESTHTVHWELPELPENIAPADIELVLMPSSSGMGQLVFSGEGDGDLSVTTMTDIQIEGVPMLSFAVTSLSDPVEVGRDAEYEIRLTNRGTKDSSDVRISVLLPESFEVVRSDGPTRFSPQGNGGSFAPLSRVAAKEEVVYHLTARCSEAGDQRVRFSVASDNRSPLTKEESVRVYGN